MRSSSLRRARSSSRPGSTSVFTVTTEGSPRGGRDPAARRLSHAPRFGPANRGVGGGAHARPDRDSCGHHRRCRGGTGRSGRARPTAVLGGIAQRRGGESAPQRRGREGGCRQRPRSHSPSATRTRSSTGSTRLSRTVDRLSRSTSTTTMTTRHGSQSSWKSTAGTTCGAWVNGASTESGPRALERAEPAWLTTTTPSPSSRLTSPSP